MLFKVRGVKMLPEIRAGVLEKEFFLDIRLKSTDARKVLTNGELPLGFKFVSISTSDRVITFLCQAPESIVTVDALVAAEGEIVLTFV
jgi:hypothetical protein